MTSSTTLVSTAPAPALPATTTYPFTFTTEIGLDFNTAIRNTSTILPSLSFTPFAPAPKCCSRWSQYPLGSPSSASCAISNDGCTNPDAFWDLYACCNGAEPKVFGDSDEFLCTGTCEAVGQSWQELMACLKERAPVVVCRPAEGEIASGNETETGKEMESGSQGAFSTAVSRTSQGDVTATSSVMAVSSTGKAGVVGGVVHVRGTKAGVAVFALIVCASVVGLGL